MPQQSKAIAFPSRTMRVSNAHTARRCCGHAPAWADRASVGVGASPCSLAVAVASFAYHTRPLCVARAAAKHIGQAKVGERGRHSVARPLLRWMAGASTETLVLVAAAVGAALIGFVFVVLYLSRLVRSTAEVDACPPPCRLAGDFLQAVACLRGQE